MNRCPTAQIVLCADDKCTMYCPTTSVILDASVQMNTWGEPQRYSNVTVSAKGLPVPGKEGYCIDENGNPCT